MLTDSDQIKEAYGNFKDHFKTALAETYVWAIAAVGHDKTLNAADLGQPLNFEAHISAYRQKAFEVGLIDETGKSTQIVRDALEDRVLTQQASAGEYQKFKSLIQSREKGWTDSLGERTGRVIGED